MLERGAREGSGETLQSRYRGFPPASEHRHARQRALGQGVAQGRVHGPIGRSVSGVVVEEDHHALMGGESQSIDGSEIAVYHEADGVLIDRGRNGNTPVMPCSDPGQQTGHVGTAAGISVRADLEPWDLFGKLAREGAACRCAVGGCRQVVGEAAKVGFGEAVKQGLAVDAGERRETRVARQREKRRFGGRGLGREKLRQAGNLLTVNAQQHKCIGIGPQGCHPVIGHGGELVGGAKNDRVSAVGVEKCVSARCRFFSGAIGHNPDHASR